MPTYAATSSISSLTAKAERADKLEGLSLGADDYLTKPFDGEELRLRLHNQLTQQRKMRERYARHFSLHPTETAGWEEMSSEKSWLCGRRLTL